MSLFIICKRSDPELDESSELDEELESDLEDSDESELEESDFELDESELDESEWDYKSESESSR